MMNIIIKETSARHELSIVDPDNGVDWIGDLVGNAGAFDREFSERNEDGEYIVAQEDYDWWREVVDGLQAAHDRIYELKEEYGSDAVYAALESTGDVDLEQQAGEIMNALDEAFGEE